MPYGDKEKQSEYQRRWIRRRREDFFLNKSCVQCGSSSLLELDHINPQEKLNHNIWSWSQIRREAEIAKCQILCEMCHAQKTAMQRRVDHPCGTWHSYGNGCRCQKCRGAWAQYVRDRRRSRTNDMGV